MRNTQIKVSVIVPAYNEEKHLDRCLKTLVNQTLSDIEIIVVDDGSRDGTYGICEQYRIGYPEKVMVLHKKNEGLGPARNSGIALARGEYIGFVDADDWVELRMYQALYDTAKANDADVVACDVKKIFVSENREAVETSLPGQSGRIDIGEYIKDGLNPAYAWNKIYKRGIWDKYKFKNMVYEDLDIVLTLLSNCSKLYYVREPFSNYFKRPNSITTSYTNIRLMDIMQAYRDAANNAHEKYKDETAFCVAKRILINLKTPGLAYYKADFIELIQELMGLFEANPYIVKDETVKGILRYKGRKTIPKNIYYTGEWAVGPSLDRFIKQYQVIRPENGLTPKDVLAGMRETGGIWVCPDLEFRMPVGGLRTEGCFLIFEHDKTRLFGSRPNHGLLQAVCENYNNELSIDQNIQRVADKFEGRTKFLMDTYKIMTYEG